MYWLLLAFIALLAFAFRPIRFTATSVRFSLHAPVAPLMLLLLILFDMEVQRWSQWRAGVALILFFGYGAYAAAMFGYVYDGTRFSWFNGLWRRSVDASSIRTIVWRRDNKRIGKVRFECGDRSVRMRTEFEYIVIILKKMAEDHGIASRTEKLPPWSV
jgi:hypothetical protein